MGITWVSHGHHMGNNDRQGLTISSFHRAESVEFSAGAGGGGEGRDKEWERIH